ncbi:MAG TPA: hypothetical protein VGH77_24355 [Streptosporangiaceae bacterium]
MNLAVVLPPDELLDELLEELLPLEPLLPHAAAKRATTASAAAARTVCLTVTS